MNLLPLMTHYSLAKKGKASYSSRMYDKDMVATVGASELACPRQSCFRVLKPAEFDLQRHIILERGHIAETLFLDALKFFDIPVETQRSYYGDPNSIFAHMKVHPDIVVEVKDIPDIDDDEMMRHINRLRKEKKILWLNEIKSAAAVPTHFHKYWHLQVMLQAGLIAFAHDIKEEDIHIELTVVNLNNGENRVFEFDWDEDVFHEGLEVSLIIQTFKEEMIEIMLGEREDFTVSLDEIPAVYNAAICSNCDYADKCSIFGKARKEFTIGDELEEDLESYVSAKETSKRESDAFDEKIRPIFKKMGVSGVGKNFEGKYTPGKKTNVLNASDIPREEIAKLAKDFPEAITINPDRLRYLDESKHAQLSKDYGTTKVSNERLIIKRKTK